MNALRLKEILDSVASQGDLWPVIDKEGHVLKTFCNIGLDRILGLYGAPRMIDAKGRPLLANDMVEFMRLNPQVWPEVTGDVACARASQGVLVVAAQASDTFKGHGHVAAIYPSPSKYSGSWAKDVPILCNIGRPFLDKSTGTIHINEPMKASWCFRQEPRYYSVRLGGNDAPKEDTSNRGEVV